MNNTDIQQLSAAEMEEIVGGATGLEFAITLAMAVVIPIATTRSANQLESFKPPLAESRDVQGLCQ